MAKARHARPSKARTAAKVLGVAAVPGIAGIALAAPASASQAYVQAGQTVPLAAIIHVVAAHQQAETPVYTVQAGDTLSSIAQAKCGTTADWTGLYKANEKVIGSDFNLILSGEQLTLDCTQAQLPQEQQVVTTADVVQQPVQTTGSPVVASGFQECVITRESGGNPRAVNPHSGAGGLYQFLPSTWAALGFSGLPEDAPVWEQNEAFQKEYALGGTSAWAPYDGC